MIRKDIDKTSSEGFLAGTPLKTSFVFGLVSGVAVMLILLLLAR